MSSLATASVCAAWSASSTKWAMALDGRPALYTRSVFLLLSLQLALLPACAQEIDDPTAQECRLDNLADRLGTVEDVCCTEPTQVWARAHSSLVAASSQHHCMPAYASALPVSPCQRIATCWIPHTNAPPASPSQLTAALPYS